MQVKAKQKTRKQLAEPINLQPYEQFPDTGTVHKYVAIHIHSGSDSAAAVPATARLSALCSRRRAAARTGARAANSDAHRRPMAEVRARKN